MNANTTNNNVSLHWYNFFNLSFVCIIKIWILWLHHNSVKYTNLVYFTKWLNEKIVFCKRRNVFIKQSCGDHYSFFLQTICATKRVWVTDLGDHCFFAIYLWGSTSERETIKMSFFPLRSQADIQYNTLMIIK